MRASDSFVSANDLSAKHEDVPDSTCTDSSRLALRCSWDGDGWPLIKVRVHVGTLQLTNSCGQDATIALSPDANGRPGLKSDFDLEDGALIPSTPAVSCELTATKKSCLELHAGAQKPKPEPIACGHC